jgi:hypothetical protein
MTALEGLAIPARGGIGSASTPYPAYRHWAGSLHRCSAHMQRYRDPVGTIAKPGAVHHGERRVAESLRALRTGLYKLCQGEVSVSASWRRNYM